MSKTHTSQCVVCNSPTVNSIMSWHYTCVSCKYEGSSLQPAINVELMQSHVSESDREIGLKAVRQENFEDIVGLLQKYIGRPDARLLDVGCAHGWFLEVTQGSFNAEGIEPDNNIRKLTLKKGFKVRGGYFPDALESHEKFDVIAFNDVIEHIPDIRSAIAACHTRLEPAGVLLINLPNSTGFFYRLSKMFARSGWAGPFARLWQEGLPSPHVHYFNKMNLELLAQDHGFKLIEAQELPSVRLRGLMQRLRAAGNVSALNVLVQYVGILLTLPVVRFFPSDIIVCAFRRI